MQIMKIVFWLGLSVTLLILPLSLVSWGELRNEEEMPEEIQNLLSNSCYGCHTTGSRAEEAVKKLDFDKWDEYSIPQKIARLNDIQEVMKEEMMPPEKFLKRYPDKKLSKEDRKKILTWAELAMEKAME